MVDMEKNELIETDVFWSQKGNYAVSNMAPKLERRLSNLDYLLLS